MVPDLAAEERGRTGWQVSTLDWRWGKPKSRGFGLASVSASSHLELAKSTLGDDGVSRARVVAACRKKGLGDWGKFKGRRRRKKGTELELDEAGEGPTGVGSMLQGPQGVQHVPKGGGWPQFDTYRLRV